MLHIRRYLKILGEAGKIIDGYGSFPDVNDTGYRGALFIYETAFEQLAVSGMPISEEKDVFRIDTDGDTFILRKRGAMALSGKATDPLRKSRPLEEGDATVNDGGGKHIGEVEDMEEGDTGTAGTAAFPQKEEPPAENTEDAAAGTGDAGEEDELLPDDYGIDVTAAKVPEYPDESTLPNESEAGGKENGTGGPAEETSAKAAVAGGGGRPAGNGTAVREGSPEPAGFNPEVLEGVETEYEKKELVEMPDHMFRDDFTFSYTDISITGANGRKAAAQAIIAPLSINEEYPRIICCTIQGDKSETVLSKDNRLKIRVGGFTVKVEGRMEDGKFKSSCVLPAHYLLEGTRIVTSTRDFGEKGHILLEEKEEDLQIHIIPATFKNNASGDAEYIYFISSGGEEKAGDTSVVKAASFTFGGKEYEIRCRWNADGVLYSMAAEKGGSIGTDGDVQQAQHAARP